MVSSNTELIRQWLRKRRFPCQVSVLDGPQPDVVFVFVPSTMVAQKKGGGRTSIRHMAYLKRMAHLEFAINIEFSVRADDALEDIESGLCAIVRQVLADQDIHVFLSRSVEGTADVWIDAHVPVGAALHALTTRVADGIRDYLNTVGLALHEVYWQGSMVPSSASVLRAVKILQPASAEQIAQYLQAHGYPGVPTRWVKTQLDKLRRHDLTVWRNDVYVITAPGLSALPASKGRVSSDIERALVLARRKW